MLNIQEKIQRQKEWVEHAKKNIQSYRNDEIRHCPVCGIVPDDLDQFVQSIVQQAVEEERKRILEWIDDRIMLLGMANNVERAIISLRVQQRERELAQVIELQNVKSLIQKDI